MARWPLRLQSPKNNGWLRGSAREEYIDFATDLRSVYENRDSKDGRPSEKELLNVSPFDWSSGRKCSTIGIACFAAVFASVAPAAYSPGEDQMAQEWHVSKVAISVGVTMFTLGFSIAGMASAPFSEVIGRKPVFIGMGVLYVVCFVCCGATRLFSGMLVARFFGGCGCSVFSTMIGGLIADTYRKEERNGPMALFSGAAVFGIGLGPLLAGFIAEYTTWRWIFWMQAIVNGCVVLLMLLFVQESREHVVLEQTAARLNRWEAKRAASPHGRDPGDRISWKVHVETPPLRTLLKLSLTRPFILLLTEPVVFVFSLWAAFSWSVLYVGLSVVPLMFEDIYGFSLSEANSVFAASCIGALLATIVGIYQESFARKRGLLPNKPEARLYFCCVEGWLLPIGLLLLGWTCKASIHWIAPAIGIGLCTAAIFFVYLAVFNFLADNYGTYASSAIAAQSFCRNALGGTMPLFSRQMYRAMTYGGASSLLAGIAALLCVAPIVLVFKGDEIRARSKFASAEAAKETGSKP